MLAGSIMSEILDEIHKQTEDSHGTSDVQSRVKVVVDKYTNKFAPLGMEKPEIPLELSKIRAMAKAYLCSHYAEEKGDTQSESLWREADYPAVHGFLDMLNKSWAYEFKYTSNPEWYGSKFAVSDQLACYFLGVSDLQRITLRAILVPTLRPKKDEPQEAYEQRIVEDFNRQSQHYIVDRNYFRTEFANDMVEVKEKARYMVHEISDAVESMSGGGIYSFWQNKASCFRPRPCQYLPLCETEVGGLINQAILETQYTQRKKPNESK